MGRVVRSRDSDARLGLQWLPLILLVAGAAILGSAPILARLSELGPTATAFYRAAFAVPAIVLVQHYAAYVSRPGTDEPRREVTRSDGVALVLAGLLFAADLTCLHWSLKYTSVANATLFLNSAPIFVTFGAWALFGERIRAQFLVGLVIAVGGIAVLVGGYVGGQSGRLFGDVLGLMAGAAYGGYILVVSRLRGRFSAAMIVAVSTAFCALPLLSLAVALGESLIALTLTGWVILLALGVLTHAGGQGLVAYALKHLPAALSSVTLLIQPVVATVVAWFLFSETLDVWQVTGIAIVLAGILLCHRAY